MSDYLGNCIQRILVRLILFFYIICLCNHIEALQPLRRMSHVHRVNPRRLQRLFPNAFSSRMQQAHNPFLLYSTSSSQASSAGTSSYNHTQIEQKWQQHWDKSKTFESRRRVGHKKKYVLDMFPYPSGAGLHVGHPEGYTATDIMSRYWRMLDYDVLHPMGWDAFGLPAEQHAINTGTHPAVTTYENIATFKRQLKSLGFSYDWYALYSFFKTLILDLCSDNIITPQMKGPASSPQQMMNT
jgi:hypothetical protein